MLKYIDVLIGLAVVMVAASMCVTVLTQAATNVWNLRGKALKQGLQDLLRQLDPALAGKIADQIAEAVLKHPLIREGENKLGAVVHREELTKLLLELATADSPHLPAEAKAALVATLRKNDIADPQTVITGIRKTALRLEQANPDLANNLRFSQAILQEASSDFVAKINGWFDQTIDRVSSRFALNARWITLFNACLIACFLQLDTLMVLNRLAVDDSLRDAVSAQARQVNDGNLTKFLNQNGLIFVPQSVGEWREHWNWNHLPGMFMSMLLLNLGAPFWFNSLKNLLQLRSLIAQKDDAQRSERQGFAPVKT